MQPVTVTNHSCFLIGFISCRVTGENFSAQELISKIKIKYEVLVGQCDTERTASLWTAVLGGSHCVAPLQSSLSSIKISKRKYSNAAFGFSTDCVTRWPLDLSRAFNRRKCELFKLPHFFVPSCLYFEPNQEAMNYLYILDAPGF